MSENINSIEIPETVGLIAGGDLLPIEFVNNVRNLGVKKIVSVGFKDYTSPIIQQKSDVYDTIGIGQLGKLIKIFKNNGVKNAVMLGALSPKLTIANLKLDLRMLMLATKVRDRRADSVLGAIVNEFTKDGICIEDSTKYLKHLLMPEGLLTKKKPSQEQLIDINFGIEIALASGALDIGQTVIVHKHAVVAVEAMEGTDKCITRAGELAKDCVIVKMAKPKQDLRFDIPCLGPITINTVINSGAKVLAVEAGKSYFLDKENALNIANKHGIVVLGITPDMIKGKK